MELIRKLIDVFFATGCPSEPVGRYARGSELAISRSFQASAGHVGRSRTSAEAISPWAVSSDSRSSPCRHNYHDLGRPSSTDWRQRRFLWRTGGQVASAAPARAAP